MCISVRGLDSTLHENMKITGWMEAELEGHVSETLLLIYTNVQKNYHKSSHKIQESIQQHWCEHDALEQTYYDRDVLKDPLPMRRDAAWFRNTFLNEICPDSRCQRNEMWPHVKGFNTALLNIFL